MQFEIHGTGTALYGRRDYLLDRSFITTEWVTVGYIPVCPLISKRISYTRLDPYHSYDSSGHFVVETIPLNMKQVLSVYAWFVSMAAWFVIAVRFQGALARKLGDEDKAGALLLILLAVILAAPYLLRRFAIWRVSRSFHRASYGLGPRAH